MNKLFLKGLRERAEKLGIEITDLENGADNFDSDLVFTDKATGVKLFQCNYQTGAGVFLSGFEQCRKLDELKAKAVSSQS